MHYLSNWIILSPLLIGILLLAYGAWQLIREIKPALKQVKSLQEEMDRAKSVVEETIPEIQSLVASASEEMQNGRALVEEGKEVFARVKEIVGIARAIDTAPVHQGIAYLQYRRDQRRIRKLPEKAKDWLEDAVDSLRKVFRRS